MVILSSVSPLVVLNCLLAFDESSGRLGKACELEAQLKPGNQSRRLLTLKQLLRPL